MEENSYKGVKSDRIQICPACGSESPQRLAFHHCPQRRGEARSRAYAVYWVSVCQACNEIILWGAEEFGGLVEFHTKTLNPLYPGNSRLDHKLVPDRIARMYEEAKRIKELSPNGFSVLVRRALESICDDKGIKSTRLNLSKRLELLVSQEQFPESVEGLTKVIRLVGNVGAHSGTEDVLPEQAEVIDDFFRFVIEFVYIVHERLQRFESSLKSSGIIK